MRRNLVLTILGAALVLIAAPAFLFIYFDRIEEEHSQDERAAAFDASRSSDLADPCLHLLREVQAPRRSLAIGESVDLTFVLRNDTADYCSIEIVAEGSGLDLQPRRKGYAIPPGETLVHWPMTAQEAGERDVTVASGAEIRSLRFIVAEANFPTRTQSLVLAVASGLAGLALCVWALHTLRGGPRRR